MERRTALQALLLLALPAACRSAGSDGPTYNGTRPSVRAVFVLRELGGETVPDLAGAFGGGDWTIGRYAVVANPVSDGGVGPVVALEKGSRTEYLPVETDGDAADLYWRVHREKHPDVDGDTSDAYRAAWKR